MFILKCEFTLTQNMGAESIQRFNINITLFAYKKLCSLLSSLHRVKEMNSFHFRFRFQNHSVQTYPCRLLLISDHCPRLFCSMRDELRREEYVDQSNLLFDQVNREDRSVITRQCCRKCIAITQTNLCWECYQYCQLCIGGKNSNWSKISV